MLMREIVSHSHEHTFPIEVIQKWAIPTRSMLWNKGGERRLIPWPMIRNAVGLLDSWRDALEAGVIPHIPPKALVIEWESCLELPEASSRVKVTADPRFDLPEQQGNPGSE